MATTWAVLLARAKRRYGLDSWNDDPLLTDLLFLDRVNELIGEMGHVAGGFRRELTLDLPTVTGAIALPAGTLRVLNRTVRVDYHGSGAFEVGPRQVQEDELRASYGVLEHEAAGIPGYYYTQRGEVSGSMLSLVLFPRSNVARVGGVKLAIRSVPVPLTIGADELPFQQSEERHLIPGICLALAEAELSRGGPRASTATVQLWESRWERALAAYADEVEDGLRGDGRSINHDGDDDD